MYVREVKDYTELSCQRNFNASSNIYDVAVDDNGDVYVAVSGNSTIEVFNQNGERIRTIGAKGAENGQLSNPRAIAIRGSVLYVAEGSNNRVQKLTTSGEFISKFGTEDSGKVS